MIKNSILIFFWFISIGLSAQCPFDNTLFADMTPTNQGETITLTNVWGGDLIIVDVILGENYEFATCTTIGIDTYMTLYNSSGSTVLAFSDDDCGANGLQPNLNWIATFTGTLNILIDEFPCANGTSDITLNVTWTDTLGLEDSDIFKDVHIYPNPTNGPINIDLRNLKEVSLKVFDLNGQLIYHKDHINKTSHKFNLNTMAGIYIIEISSQEKRNYYKLIKN